MVSTVVPLALYLGAPPALEAKKLLLWSACLLLDPLALDLGPQVASRAFWYPKEPHWLLGARVL